MSYRTSNMSINMLNEIYVDFKNKLERNGYVVSALELIDYGIQFSYTSNNQVEYIRVYQNKKGKITIDYSQIKDIQKRTRIISILGQFKISNSNESIVNKLHNSSGFENIFPNIGTDESGKGDYFGPLSIAGVLLDEKDKNKLLGIGVKDSKLITDENIYEISENIRSIINKDKFTVVYINPEKYNELYGKINNLNRLLAWGHARALENLLILNTCSVAIADQFGDETYIKNALMKRGKEIKLIQMPKAEQYTSVAAASIFAREAFLMQMKVLSEKYNMILPKGASIHVEETARRIIQVYGKDELRKVAKLHFKTTKKVLV